MKKLTLLLVLTCILQATATSQSCLSEGITFTTQTQIDSFQINYPNCTEIEGDVEIYGDDINNLSALNVLTMINGNLVIGNPYADYQSANPDLNSLEGLDNITSIGGSIQFYKNAALVNMVGLDNLGIIEEDLILNRNAIVNLIGMENLVSIGGDLNLDYNGDLQSLLGLSNLTSVGGNLMISQHYGLYSISALENLKFIGEDIQLINNNALPDLKGLEKITHIGQDLYLGSNGSVLNSLSGLNNLNSIGRDLKLLGNYGLINLEGLDNLNTIGRTFEIRGNNHMTSLVGVENLDTVYGGLCIRNVNKISSLEGLENLDFVGGELEISGNELLTSIVELESIDAASISNLFIIGNIALSECHVQYVCDYLTAPKGSINITSNAPGCSNPVEVADSCGFTLGCLPNGNYFFNSQHDIDNFQFMYPGCSALNGDILIYGKNISNLNGLSQVTSIDRNLEITGIDSLNSFQGFNNLSLIGGNFLIDGAKTLSDMSALNNLVSVDGDLIIKGTKALVSLEGFENLTSVKGNLELGANDRWGIWWGISGNESLAKLDGLNNLKSINGSFGIIGSGELSDLNGLENLESVGGDLEIYDNDSLSSLNGLEKLNSIEGSLFIGKLIFFDHDGHLELRGNPSLNSLQGLNSLEKVIGNLWIIGNENLQNLSGLDNMHEGSLDSLWIYQNSLLASCEVQSICKYLANPSGEVNIYSNALGCNSPEEVQDSCWVSTDEYGVISGLKIQPNPFTQTTAIAYELQQPSTVQINIFNHLGAQVDFIQQNQSAGKQQIVWHAEGLPAGVYFCVLKTESGTKTMKMIKLK